MEYDEGKIFKAILAYVTVGILLTFVSVLAYGNFGNFGGGVEDIENTCGHVTYVYDGDTIHVENYGKVRLRNVDAPEWDTKAGEKATEATERRVLGTVVCLQNESERYTDKYGRIVSYVYYNTFGDTLGSWLVESGHAVVDNYDNSDNNNE